MSQFQAPAQLTLIAFLVVMLVVPWMMAGRSSGVEPPLTERGFASRRERLLWFWTLAVLVAIYSTLLPARRLADALRERGLLSLSSGAALLLVGVVLTLRWARHRPAPLERGAALGVAAVYFTTLIRLPAPEARTHLFEYGLVSLLIYHALRERKRHGRIVPLPAAQAIIATALLGWVDEGIQLLLPTRVYDLRDVGFNALAGLMAVSASLAMAWVRRRAGGRGASKDG
jgi:VanZ family protein